MLALYAGVFLVSAGTLLFEITLTRLFSVTQWYHFAFISVSVALLGFGASGTWLALRPSGKKHLRECCSAHERDCAVLRRLTVFAGLFSLGVLIAYLAINYVPFDSYRVAWERRQLLYLAIYYSALIVPFFFSGLCVGLSLSAWPGRANALYAANLAGSAIGSLAVLVLLPLLGGEGTVVVASVLGVLSALVFTAKAPARRRIPRYVGVILLLGQLVLLMRPPAWFDLRLSPYKTLSQVLLFPQARLASSRWNSFSRVDVVDSEGIHSAPGLSLSFPGEIPEQLGLMVDGGNLSPITCIDEPGDALFLQYLPSALPYILRPGARVLLIEPRGGLDLLMALHGDASSIVALEDNPLVVETVRDQSDRCASATYDEQRVTVVFEGARAYLRRSTGRFDVVLLSLADTYRPVVSGAYGLSEAYAYTEEAFCEYLEHLEEDGLLVITRWVQSPPSEELRACGLLLTALERAGVGDLSERIIAFRTWSTVTFLAKRTAFDGDEIAKLKVFCRERSFDLIYYPGMGASEANRYNLLDDTVYYDAFLRLLSPDDRQVFVEQYPYEIAPPVDDRPFFFHNFRWEQTQSIVSGLGKTWQPFGGSGFLVLVALLSLAVVLSVVLVLLPLVVRGTTDFQSTSGFASLRWVLLYFSCLGLGFLFVEMPLLQQFILFLGQPAYSFSLVLFSILLFSGLGSLVSPRLPLRALLLILVAVVLVYPLCLSRLFALAIGWSLTMRLIVVVLSLAPLGFLLGLPLAGGIRLLEERAPQLIPWAWAVNGCASVVSSILAVMGAVTFGFSRVLLAGALAYFLAWLTLASLPQLEMEVAA